MVPVPQLGSIRILTSLCTNCLACVFACLLIRPAAERFLALSSLSITGVKSYHSGTLSDVSTNLAQEQEYGKDVTSTDHRPVTLIYGCFQITS